MWGSVVVLCFVVRYFLSILALQSSCVGGKSWLLWLMCLNVPRRCCVALPRVVMGL